MKMKNDAHITEHRNSLTGNIARTPGAPKTCGKPPAIHPGMHAKQVAKAGLGGMGHPYAGAPDASSSNPMDPEPKAKRLTPPRFTPGMRSRGPVTTRTEEEHHAHGRKVMAEGVAVENCKLPPPDNEQEYGPSPPAYGMKRRKDDTDTVALMHDRKRRRKL